MRVWLSLQVCMGKQQVVGATLDACRRKLVVIIGAWDELLSTCMEGEKSCKEMMMVHASGGKRKMLKKMERAWCSLGHVGLTWASIQT